MQKIVINNDFGGFSLSPLATKRLAELKGKECYFFDHNFGGREGGEKYKPLTLEQAEVTFCWLAYTVPNPQDYRLGEPDEDGSYHSANERSKEIYLSNRDIDRDDPDLIKVVEELGDKANGSCACLKIVEIPDGVKWEIEEYDGNEHIAESHQTWS